MWEESRILLGGGLRILFISGGPSGSKPQKAAPQRRMRQRSQPCSSRETAPTVFETHLSGEIAAVRSLPEGLFPVLGGAAAGLRLQPLHQTVVVHYLLRAAAGAGSDHASVCRKVR